MKTCTVLGHPLLMVAMLAVSWAAAVPLQDTQSLQHIHSEKELEAYLENSSSLARQLYSDLLLEASEVLVVVDPNVVVEMLRRHEAAATQEEEEEDQEEEQEEEQEGAEEDKEEEHDCRKRQATFGFEMNRGPFGWDYHASVGYNRRFNNGRTSFGLHGHRNWGASEVERWYYECKEQWPLTENEEKPYTVLLFLLTFALPVSGLSYTYLSIVAMMCAYRMPGNAEPSRDLHYLHAKMKMINMMIAVMVCFVPSWLPLQVLQFLIYFVPEITHCRGRQCLTYYMSFFVCHWIAMANSSMNPFIYCFVSKNFREDFLQFLRKCGCRRDMRRRRSPPWSHSDLGSSFRSILNITHKTSVRSPSRGAGVRARQDRQREGEDTELRLLQPSHGNSKDNQVSRSSAKWRVVRSRSSGGRGGSGKAVLAVKTSTNALQGFASATIQDAPNKTNDGHYYDPSCLTQRPHQVLSPSLPQCSTTVLDSDLLLKIPELLENKCFSKVNLQREN